MLMTVYTLNKDVKEIWCIKVRTVRAGLGISGKSGYSGKKIRTLRAFRTPVKNNIHQEIFNLAYSIRRG
jgi:hypothetical protein